MWTPPVSSSASTAAAPTPWPAARTQDARRRLRHRRQPRHQDHQGARGHLQGGQGRRPRSDRSRRRGRHPGCGFCKLWMNGKFTDEGGVATAPPLHRRPGRRLRQGRGRRRREPRRQAHREVRDPQLRPRQDLRPQRQGPALHRRLLGPRQVQPRHHQVRPHRGRHRREAQPRPEALPLEGDIVTPPSPASAPPRLSARSRAAAGPRRSRPSPGTLTSS